MKKLVNLIAWLRLIIVWASIITVFCGVIYGGYWLAKHLSYSFFYEDMVERTVYENVKTECLK